MENSLLTVFLNVQSIPIFPLIRLIMSFAVDVKKRAVKFCSTFY